MRPFEVDVPVRVMIWTRPDCLRQQFEVIKKAAPSTLFLISDGGRNSEEKSLIEQSRKIFDDIDWECSIYKLFYEENQGMYTMMKNTRELVWSKVDRCVFLEDDYVPAVSFFKFCAELLEKYKDDERIQMICGNNVLGTYPDAEPNDYFFTENGWSIWGSALWKRSIDNWDFPFDYSDNNYIKRCLKDNLNEFWYKKVSGYCEGELVDNHVPGGEYYHAVNSTLFHRVSIVPTKNMIKNIGFEGAHFAIKDKSNIPRYMNLDTYEIDFPIRHPKYVIDDKFFGKMYDEILNHDKKNPIFVFLWRVGHFIKLIFTGKAVSAIKSKFKKKEVER